jgi:hypothetical protein
VRRGGRYQKRGEQAGRERKICIRLEIKRKHNVMFSICGYTDSSLIMGQMSISLLRGKMFLR